LFFQPLHHFSCPAICPTQHPLITPFTHNFYSRFSASAVSLFSLGFLLAIGKKEEETKAKVAGRTVGIRL
jgi:hypothetical protein